MAKPAVYMTLGLPGSGKSTWAKDMVDKSYSIGNHKLKRVNKDELRAMLDAGHHSKANEAFVINLRNRIVGESLGAGCSIIVDDTNFHPSHEKALREIAEKYGARFIIEDRFLNVSVEECIKNDLKRPNSVGAEVIRGMHHQYLQKGANVKATQKPAHVEGVPQAIIVDLDGTLALMGDRSPYDGERCEVDSLNVPVDLLASEWYMSGGDLAYHGVEQTRHVIFCSGRDGKAREATELWLEKNDWDLGDDIHLYMRAPGDSRKDSIVKEEIYREHIEGKYNVAFVLDDRNQVVDMWRSLGLTCLQVAPGDF